MEEDIEILRLADDGCPHHLEPDEQLLDELAAMGEFGGISAPVRTVSQQELADVLIDLRRAEYIQRCHTIYDRVRRV